MVCDLHPDGSEGDDGFDQARLARFFRSRSERCPHRRTLFCRSGLPDRSHSQDDSDLRDQDPVGHSSRTSIPYLLFYPRLRRVATLFAPIRSRCPPPGGRHLMPN